MKPLQGKVAVVAGATRGAGRGIATELGAAGATVYCTGRSIRGETTGRPETIEETAEAVTDAGGLGIPLRVDHTVEEEVKALFERISKEQGGQLDFLVNDIWGGDALTQWGKPFWELDWSNGLRMQEQAVHSHILTSRYGVPLMVARRQGIVFEITDGDGLYYRGNLFYDLAKVTAIRLAFAMAIELRPHEIAAIAVTPGFLRSEAMLDYFGVTEANWREAVKQDPHFVESETPRFVGRAVVALACDPEIRGKSGRVLASWTLAREYGFSDVDGRHPDWLRYCEENLPEEYARITKHPGY